MTLVDRSEEFDVGDRPAVPFTIEPDLKLLAFVALQAHISPGVMKSVELRWILSVHRLDDLSSELFLTSERPSLY